MIIYIEQELSLWRQKRLSGREQKMLKDMSVYAKPDGTIHIQKITVSNMNGWDVLAVFADFFSADIKYVPQRHTFADHYVFEVYSTGRYRKQWKPKPSRRKSNK